MTPHWQTEDGSVQLYNCDCLDLLRDLRGYDATIADPPYGMNKADWDVSVVDWVSWIPAVMRFGPLAVFCGVRGIDENQT